MRNKRFFLSILLIILCTGWSGNAVAVEYTLGVVPQFDQLKTYSVWKPIIDELQRKTGFTFRLISAQDISTFEKLFVKGKCDVVYVNPYHMLKAYESQGYLPLVRDKKPLRGILVVQKNSSIQKVADLNGKTIAFPSPNALGASLLMRADLERIFGITFKPLYVKTHSMVYLHVMQNTVPAGGGVEKTFRQEKKAIQDALRVLYTTREMPSHPIAAHPRVPQEHREKIRNALFEIAATEKGRKLLSRIPLLEPVPSSMGDYLIMKDWNLDRYWDPSWVER